MTSFQIKRPNSNTSPKLLINRLKKARSKMKGPSIKINFSQLRTSLSFWDNQSIREELLSVRASNS